MSFQRDNNNFMQIVHHAIKLVHLGLVKMSKGIHLKTALACKCYSCRVEDFGAQLEDTFCIPLLTMDEVQQKMHIVHL